MPYPSLQIYKFEGVSCLRQTTHTSKIRMEGANGKILDTEDPRVVIKKIHRRNRAQHRMGSHTAVEQQQLQETCRRLCEQSGFKILFVPRAWAAERFHYKMERICVDKPLEVMEAKDHSVFEELKLFYAACKKRCLFPADIELYIQPDGRVAMVDFDKCAEWISETGEILFPWGLTVTDTNLLEPLGLGYLSRQ
jgi:hypothetical protein